MGNGINRFCRILYFSTRRYQEDQHSRWAIALTYYTLFAIVPFAALLFGIAKGFDLETRLQEVFTERLSQHRELLLYVYQFAQTTLREAQGGVVAGVGVIVLIWTVMRLASSVENAFNAVWDLPMQRSLLRRASDYLSLLVLTPIILVCTSSAGVMVRNFLEHLAQTLPRLSSAKEVALSLSADLSPLLISCVFFILIYRLVPNTRVLWRSAVLSGIFTGICFQLLQDGFLFLQRMLFHYNQIYGSFAILPLFLIWLCWSWQLLLFGAEISFVSQNLDTGIFFDSLRNVTKRQRRIHQLAELKLIVNFFDGNHGPMPLKDLASSLQLPETQLKSELQELVQCGLLCGSRLTDGRIAWLPGRPADRLDLSQFLSLLDGETLKNPQEIFVRCAQALNRIDTVIRDSKENCSIRDI